MTFPAAEADGTPSLVIVTGLSGAGRSTTAKAFEDLGWFVVDNLPPSLLPTMVDLATRARDVDHVAAVVDLRSRAFTTDLQAALAELASRGLEASVLFLEASDPVLVRRFEGVRRPHPLSDGGRLVDGVAAEREILRGLRGDADIVLDTSNLTPHALRAEVEAVFGEDDSGLVNLTVLSFGFKYGLPLDADVVLDLRFLPNPHWDPVLRPHTGQEEPVRDYVLGLPEAQDFLDRFEGLFATMAAGYHREGKRHLELAVGCTGGRHRSVAMAEELVRRLGADPNVAGDAGSGVRLIHRDLGRE